MTVVHTNRVDLLFVTLDTVWCTDIISEEPSIGFLVSVENWVICQHLVASGDCGSQRRYWCPSRYQGLRGAGQLSGYAPRTLPLAFRNRLEHLQLTDPQKRIQGLPEILPGKLVLFFQ